MFILFEMSNARGGYTISNYDCMGYTANEQIAIMWVRQNPDFRLYKYCPLTELA